MSADHNPGPWAAFDKDGKCLDCDNWSASSDDHGSTQHQPILDAKGKVIALVVSRSRSPWSDAPDTDANARLVASAPDLLAERDRLKAANAELAEALGFLVDVLDDVEKNAPEHRCYVARAQYLAMNEGRAALAKHHGAAK